MVAGSRLSINTDSNAPFAPARCSAVAMNQFVEYSLSPPRGPDCWMSDTKAVPMNVAFQLPNCVISMGIGHAAGFADVPEARPMRDISAGFISCAANGTTLTMQIRQSFFMQIMALLNLWGGRPRLQRVSRPAALNSTASNAEKHRRNANQTRWRRGR